MFTRPASPFLPADQVLAVSELVRHARRLLEGAFPLGWVGGEVVNLTRAASGHVYFTLRDSDAQVRCVMYRSRAQLIPFRLQEGQQVEVRALTTLYEPRGEFQLQVEGLRAAGCGRLFEALLRLKERLAAEGLFDEARKRPLPALPRGIGVVTSTAGAALHDVLVTLRRRAANLRVVIYPSPVQGAEAGNRLADAVASAGRRAQADGIDVLLLCRGGGSLEDLWAFNDETLVRTIAACPLPVVTGIGHETDFTLADFVADVRAATPTAAAELVSAGTVEALGELTRYAAMLPRLAQRQVDRAWERSDRARARLRHPRDRLARQQERVDMLTARLQRAANVRTDLMKLRASALAQRLRRAAPAMAKRHEVLAALQGRLDHGVAGQLLQGRQRLDSLGAQLGQLDPTAVLARGYAIVRNQRGQVVRLGSTLSPGERIKIETNDTHISAQVETLLAKGSNPDPLPD
ncbi:exodeoxyribonuclease VII large subunit [Niveibacterium umoris]|uniref:exodeoxyribonuclease VII large subunit n=1 Tax=Niveibacterium umoris TaxID=1193620 RepID=UPI001A8C5154|nr:exodeoxyribonuclease VII large subunit [Niveibacterium umoris]